MYAKPWFPVFAMIMVALVISVAAAVIVSGCVTVSEKPKPPINNGTLRWSEKITNAGGMAGTGPYYVIQRIDVEPGVACYVLNGDSISCVTTPGLVP